VIKALNDLGVPAVFGGRNDILVDGMKISGNAQAFYLNRFLHHGTILMDADLTMLGKILVPKPDKIESKGIKSVRARVTNIKPYLKTPVSMKDFKDRLLQSLLNTQDIQPYVYQLTKEDEKRIRQLMETKFSTWAWNYGESPKFSIEKYGRYEGGGVSLRFNIEEGNVKQVKIFGDFLGTQDIIGLEKLLLNLPFTREAFQHRLKDVNLDDYFLKITLDNLLACCFN
jgi:lipoate-protein ligase A